jgi:membrane protein DedA with SNARE-associated domain
MFDQFTQFIVDWIQVQPIFLIYLYFFLISYIENVFPPIPGDVLVAFAGYLVAESILNFTLVYIVTVIGSVIGFYHVYYLGTKWGVAIYSKSKQHWVLKFLDIKYIEKGRDWMTRFGQGVVIANRFLAGTRSVIALIAGMSHLPKGKTMISSTISSVVWNAVLIGLGWLIHKN